MQFRVKETAFWLPPVVYMRTYSLDEHKLLFQPVCGIEIIMRRTGRKIRLALTNMSISNDKMNTPFSSSRQNKDYSVPTCLYKIFLAVDVNIGFMVASTPGLYIHCIVYIVLLR